MEKINEKMEVLFKISERFHEVAPDIFEPSILDINGNSIELILRGGCSELKIKVFKTEASDIKDRYLIYINDKKITDICITEEVVLKCINGIIYEMNIKFEECEMLLKILEVCENGEDN